MGIQPVERLNQLLNGLPFMLMATGKDMKLSRNRIIEGLIIAIFAGGVSAGAMVYVNSAEIDSMKSQINRVDSRLQVIYELLLKK